MNDFITIIDLKGKKIKKVNYRKLMKNLRKKGIVSVEELKEVLRE